MEIAVFTSSNSLPLAISPAKESRYILLCVILLTCLLRCALFVLYCKYFMSYLANHGCENATLNHDF